jgi:alkylation response protein AidB-like acyl-CoA dehydrogenase
VLAVHVLRDAALEEPRARLLPAIAAGRSTATVALPESGDVVATVDGGSWRLDGTCTRVIDGCTANVLLVVARAGDEVALFDVEGSAPGVERSALPTLDLTRKLARVAFRAAPATRASDGDSIAGLPRAVRATIAALAAEQVGGAERCLEQAAEYSKTRLQFGRPIGSYQAIKHKCADMLVEVELARSAAYHAAFRALADEDDAAMAAHMAKAYCSEAYVHAAADNIQIHGGMGFTWEHPAHLHFKRAKASSVMFGDPVLHRREIARALDL